MQNIVGSGAECSSWQDQVCEKKESAKGFTFSWKDLLAKGGIKRELSWVLSVTELGNVETEEAEEDSFFEPFCCFVFADYYTQGLTSLQNIVRPI